MKRSTKNRILTIFIILIFIGSTAAFSILSSFENRQENNINWKAQIVILIFGEVYPIPANIGVNNETKAKVYTLSTDGIIYKSTNEDVTLKDFFEVWGQTFNSTCILDYCNNENNSVVLFVNGKENSEYELYKINNNDFIIIDYR